MSVIHIRQGVRIRTVAAPVERVAVPPVLVATPKSDTEIELSWQFNDSQDADFAELEESADGLAGWANFATEPRNASPYTRTGRSASTEYFYRARALITEGSQTSGYSSVVSATTTAGPGLPQLPPAPTATETLRLTDEIEFLLAVGAVTGATSIDWWIEARTAGAYSNGSSGSPNNAPGSSLSVPDHAIPRLENDSESELFVRGKNLSGLGPSNSVLISVRGNLIAPVLSVAVVTTDDVQGTVTPDPDAIAATGYEVERNSGAGFSQIDTFAPADLPPQFLDSNRPAGSHIYRVRAIEAPSRFGPYSAERAAFIGAPPPSGAVAGQDFTLMSSLADLNPGFGGGNLGAGNILFDDGSASGNRGVLMRFVAQPFKCEDQSLGFFLNWAGAAEWWVEFQTVFSANWTTRNANCTSPQPDYKMVLFYFLPTFAGRDRLDWKVGLAINQTTFIGHGFPGDSNWNTPHASSPVRAPDLWNNSPAVYRLHYKGENVGGAEHETMQAMINGQVQHSYKDLGNPARGASVGKKFKLGSNRNLGATEEMYHWWQHFFVYVSDPGWFTGVPITDRTAG